MTIVKHTQKDIYTYSFWTTTPRWPFWYASYNHRFLQMFVKKSQQTFHKPIILRCSIFLIICSTRMAKGNCLMHACMAIIFAFIAKTFSIKPTWLHFLFRIGKPNEDIRHEMDERPSSILSVAFTLFSKLMCFPFS